MTKKASKLSILLTNDDGIYSEGIKALYDSLGQIGNVTIVAPDAERSAVGHAITLSDPLRVKEVKRNGKFFGYATTGTPADCVKLAIRAILKKKPDIVISGIRIYNRDSDHFQLANIPVIKKQGMCLKVTG